MSVNIPDKLLFFLQERAQYKVAYGGRGGAKSIAVADSIIIRCVERKTRVMCARENQNSIAESVHHLLEQRIDQLGLMDAYIVQRDSIRCANGSEIFFVGLHNTKNLKSTSGVDICWVEEAESVSEESWATLLPTIREEGSEVWVTFNPGNEDDPTSQRWIINPPPGAIVRKVNWQDNPFFPDALKRQMEHAYKIDPESAAHVWGGEFRSKSDAQIFLGKYTIAPFEPNPKTWGTPRFGLDFGFSQDPTAAVKMWVFDRKLYYEYEICQVGLDIDRTPSRLNEIPGMRDGVTWADSARPESISYLARHGYPLIFPVQKWNGSVEDGIAHMRSYDQIVIHPRCVNTSNEHRLYRYKVDKLSGKVLTDIVDANNHCIDGGRYALNSDIQARMGDVKGFRMW